VDAVAPAEGDSLAGRLRLLRASLGLSQEQLARQLNVSFATVNRWESGHSRASPRALLAIAELEATAASGTGARGTAPGDTAPGDTALRGTRPEDPRRTWLPTTQSSFVGREHELAELGVLLGQVRLISLTGPGGAGKTRLAVELARRWASPAGTAAAANVLFVSLESVRPPRSVVSALASRLGLPDRRHVPLLSSLAQALADGPSLLVLDGAEHHPAQVVDVAEHLLQAVPELRIVLTTRVVLGVTGEVCWAVPPLDCPPVAAGAADIVSCDAVRLFLARAAERRPGLSAADVAPHAVGELCRRLGGLPLAIELIAGWVGTLSIQEILRQHAALLDYDPSGRRKLTDVLRASYDLLDPGQQRVLRALSIFAGTFSLTDAEQVLAAPPGAAVHGAPPGAAGDGAAGTSGAVPSTAADAVRGLVDASWLVVLRGAEQNRFSMVEAIRMFARAQLTASGEATEAGRRHALHFASMARESERGLAGADAHAWTARMEADVDDLHAALHWAAGNDAGLGLRTSAALWRWWLVSGRLAIGKTWLDRFLTAADDTGEQTGRALSAAAILAAENGDYAEAVRRATRAMVIFESLGLTDSTAQAATVLASAQRYLGDSAGARQSFQAALDLRTAAGERRAIAAALNNLALIEHDEGNLDRATELFQRALLIKRQLGEPRPIAIGLANLASPLIRGGQLKAAGTALREAARLGAGQPHIMGTVLCNQGHLAAMQRQWKQAAAHFDAAIAAYQIGGHRHDMLEAMIGLGTACHRIGRDDDAARHLHAAQALAHEIADPQRLAEVEAALAEISSEPEPSGLLTPRQAEVLALLADGLTNKQIAARLYLSPGTVERHLATIYHKLGLGGRVDATRYVIEHGLTRQTL
jgi:predicted ATPase/DNA-binding CsgD family transcriptional regulator/DNA-binding XRE family transcriptional regulator